MTITELYQTLISRFTALSGVKPILSEPITVTASVEPEITLRPENDPPSTVNKPEYCVTADFRGSKGEAYTETPQSFAGTLLEALEIAPGKTGINAVTIASINAVMSYLSLCPGTFPSAPDYHCRYAKDLCSYVTERFGRSKIVLVGYDGYIVRQFMDEKIDFWTLDRNPAHICQDFFNHVIVNGAKRNRESSFAWGNVFLVTGSTLCNGTITDYLNSGKELLFYGITCAGAAVLLDLPWFSISDNPV